MKNLNLLLLGAALALLGNGIIGGIAEDIRRGQSGYDSIYYRYYVPYSSPVSSAEGLAQVRNVPVGQLAWIRSGAGCEYLIEHAYDADWRHHLMKVHEARSRWGLPCPEARWWASGSVIAGGGADDCSGRWRAWREEEGGGFVLRWRCDQGEAK